MLVSPYLSAVPSADSHSISEAIGVGIVGLTILFRAEPSMVCTDVGGVIYKVPDHTDEVTEVKDSG